MIEEFAVYSLSETFVYLVGGLKIVAALGLLIGFFKEKIILPSALVMASLMVGAIYMHFKVSDDAIKFLPAGLMIIFSVAIIFLQKNINSTK